jgi:hypothetical protein
LILDKEVARYLQSLRALVGGGGLVLKRLTRKKSGLSDLARFFIGFLLDIAAMVRTSLNYNEILYRFFFLKKEFFF